MQKINETGCMTVINCGEKESLNSDISKGKVTHEVFSKVDRRSLVTDKCDFKPTELRVRLCEECITLIDDMEEFVDDNKESIKVEIAADIVGEASKRDDKILSNKTPDELENQLFASIEREEREEIEERIKEEKPQPSYSGRVYNIAATALSYVNPLNYSWISTKA